MWKRIFSFFVILFVGCASATQPPPTYYNPCSDRRVRIAFHADSSFSGPEAKAIGLAMQDWWVFTDGRADFTVTFDRDTIRDVEAPQILKLWEDSPEVLIEEYRISLKYGGDGLFIGLQLSNPVRLLLVMNDLTPEKLRYLTSHELGHAAGLWWPGAGCKPGECIHAPDKGAQMAKIFSNKPLGFQDRVMCTAACLCR